MRRNYTRLNDLNKLYSIALCNISLKSKPVQFGNISFEFKPVQFGISLKSKPVQFGNISLSSNLVTLQATE